MAVTQKRDGRWAVVFYEAGRQRWEYFGRGLQAEAAARQYDKTLKASGRLRTYRKQPPALSPTVTALADSYVAAKSASMPRTSLRNLLWKLSGVILPELGHIQALRLNEGHLDRYVQNRLQSAKRTTIHRELSDLQAILNWSVRRKLITHNPVAGYEKPRRDDEIIAPPTIAEIRKIYSKAADHLKRAIFISYFTGLRPGNAELYRLKWSDVNFIDGVIFVRSASKGGVRARLVPIHDKFRDKLQRWYEQDQGEGYLISYRGARVRSVKKAFAAAKRRAGISRRIRLYDLRHAFATAILAEGGDLKSTSELLGHSRPDTTTRIYQHTDLTMHRANINRLPDISD